MKQFFLAAFASMLCQTVICQDNINLVGYLPITNLPIHDVWGYTDSSSGTKYALLAASNLGMRVINLSNPTDPIQVGSTSGSGVQAIDIKTWMNYAYVVAESISLSGKIIDLSDPTTPVQVGTFPGGHNLFISDDGYMYQATPGLRIYDLNIDPSAPELVYTDNTCNGHDISVIGTRLYDFADNCGTRIFDISEPSDPTLLGTVPPSGIFHHSGWPTEDGNYLMICDELASPSENDITMWDISNLSLPVMVDSYNDPNSYVHNSYIIGDYAHVSYYRAGYRVFDISDPTNVTLVDEYDTDEDASGPGYGGNFGLYPFWGIDLILASDEEKGLYLFSFDEETLSIENRNGFSDKFKIYPVPASNKINLSLSDIHTQYVEVSILNIQGKVLLKEKIEMKSVDMGKEFNLYRFDVGQYTFRIEIDGQIESRNFIIAR